MLKRVQELKNKAIEGANYYFKISFPNLASEFSEFAKILDEIENVLKENVDFQNLETAPKEDKKNEEV